MKKLFVASLVLFFFMDMGLAQSRSEKKKAKKMEQVQEFELVTKIFDSGAFGFVAGWAITKNGTRIGLSTNPNSFIKIGDKANANLPYFGQSQASAMGADVGIKFEGAILEQQKKKINSKKFQIIYSFQVRGTNGERLNCTMKIQSNGSAILNVASSQRSFISYEGAFGPLAEK